MRALEEHKERQDKERVTAGSLWRGSPCVFTTPIGTPVDPRNDYREFKKLLGTAGLPPVRRHDLRHTAASLLVAQGVPPRVVMAILGHNQIALTMNAYSHVAPEVSREAADRIAETLWHDGEDQADEPDAARTRTRRTANDGRCCSVRKQAAGHRGRRPVSWEKLVRRQGLEPRTRRLRVCCSAS